MASDRIMYCVNAKAKGKIHRLTRETAHLPRPRQRLQCGWKLSGSVSLVYTCARLRYGTLCLKCFPDAKAAEREQNSAVKNDEDIEEFF